MSIKFSIIIPAYNAEPYVYELLDCLDKQISSEVEVILIDDGSKKPVIKQDKYSWLKLYRQENKGTSAARNHGLDLAKGTAIGFIDADDLVSENYVSFVLNALETKEWDYIDLSWKSLENNKFIFRLKNDNDKLSNPSACTRVFKKSFIGNIRFPIKKDACEDEDFTRHLGLSHGKRICAREFMYFYRTETQNSNSKTFLANGCKTKRIAYYFKTVTKDMDYLIDEIKKEDETNEVFLLTNRNDIPELAKYCQFIIPPKPIKAMEKRGEPTNLIKIIPKPLRTQVIIFTSQTFEIGGIETFIYSFCKQMSKYYDITVLYDSIASNQFARLSEIVPVIKNVPERMIFCDTLIINRIGDRIPSNINYKQTVQMAHCIKQQPTWHIPQDRDYIVNVSQASKDSFKEEAEKGIVIHNLTIPEKTPKALLLVSALRVGASDKQGNDERFLKFARMLDKANIKYLWLYFGDKPLKNEPENMIYCGLRLDLKPYIAKADYLVQLSGSEAFSYSLLESLELRTPVIVTPLAQNEDMGIVDGQNGYIVPFEVDGFDVRKLLKIPRFDYKHDNEGIIEQWRGILGNTVPTHDYQPQKEVTVEVLTQYRDMRLDEIMTPKTRFNCTLARALDLQSFGFVRVIE